MTTNSTIRVYGALICLRSRSNLHNDLERDNWINASLVSMVNTDANGRLVVHTIENRTFTCSPDVTIEAIGQAIAKATGLPLGVQQ